MILSRQRHTFGSLAAFMVCWIAIFAGAVFTAQYMSLSIVRAEAEVCADKIEKTKCQKEVQKTCTDSTKSQKGCENNVAKKYRTVLQACKGKINSDACHKKVEDECKQKIGENLDRCRAAVSKRYKDRKDDGYTAVNTSGLDGTGKYRDQCGRKAPNGSGSEVNIKINFGCIGDDYEPSDEADSLNPILDMAYAIIRFMSVGIGVVIVGSIVYAGIQYSASQGSPEQTAAAKQRIQDALIGLIIYVFIFAIVQWLVPGGLFSSALPVVDLSMLHWLGGS